MEDDKLSSSLQADTSDLQGYIAKRRAVDPAFAEGFDLSYTDFVFAEYKRFIEQSEMAQDVRDYDEAMRRIASGEEMVPGEVVDALLEGQNPLRVWREYRGYTLQALAERCGVSRQMLSMVENGKARPSADLLARLSNALGCDMDDLHG